MATIAAKSHHLEWSIGIPNVFVTTYSPDSLGSPGIMGSNSRPR